MMLIIEIHVDTVEEANPSTRKERVEESSQQSSPERAQTQSQQTGSRLWKAINLNFPGSLISQDKTRDERKK